MVLFTVQKADTERVMAYYMYQVAYSQEAWATLVNHPQNREAAVRPIIEKMGGSIEGFWLAFGDYDSIVIVNMPDNVTTAALSIAAAASGAIKDIRTVPLMTVEEGLEAMTKAADAGYLPPRERDS